MTLFRSADEVVVRDAHPLPQIPELRRDLVGVLLRSCSRGLRRPLDLLPVLIGAGKEESVGAQKPLPPRYRIARDGRIRVPDVRARIHGVNRGRNVELSFHDVACGLSAKMYLRRLS